jgi:hypothetical protein
MIFTGKKRRETEAQTAGFQSELQKLKERQITVLEAIHEIESGNTNNAETLQKSYALITDFEKEVDAILVLPNSENDTLQEPEWRRQQSEWEKNGSLIFGFEMPKVDFADLESNLPENEIIKRLKDIADMLGEKLAEKTTPDTQAPATQCVIHGILHGR